MAMLKRFLLLAVLAGVAATSETSPSLTAADFACPASYPCGGGDVDLRYPFWVDSGNDASYCGYPSLRLDCRSGTPVLRLPSGDYAVTRIMYGDNNSGDRTLAIFDIGVSRNMTCPLVAGRNLTLPAGSPPPLALTQRDTNVSFYMNCAFRATATTAHLLPCLDTPGGSHHTYFFGDSDAPIPYSSAGMCDAVVGMPVLRGSLANSSGLLDDLMAALRKGFELQWIPATGGDCGDCEEAGGLCGVEAADQASKFKCFTMGATPPAAKPSGMTTAVKIIIVVLVVLVVAGFLTLFGYWGRNQRLSQEPRIEMSSI